MENKKLRNEIKPCPFCGGKAEYHEEYGAIRGSVDFFIECSECGARPFLTSDASGENYIDLIESVFQTWNRRPVKNDKE